MTILTDTVSQKKRFLASLIKAPFNQLAQTCGSVWSSADEVTQSLQHQLCKLPHCQLLYAIDKTGKQLSANITRNQVDNSWRGQDLSARPYLKGNLPYQGLILSPAYLSQRSMQPCITAMQAVRHADQLVGFIAADFHLKDLPVMSSPALRRAQQLSNGPASHGRPSRVISSVDDNIDYLTYVLITLMQEHGVFQAQIHFTSARCVLWSIDNPFHYQPHTVEELMMPELFIQYPKQTYIRQANTDQENIPLVMAQIKALREGNDTNYLRSASLNIINNLVSLTFVSDGTQYIAAGEFLNRELPYWLGKPVHANIEPTASLHKN